MMTQQPSKAALCVFETGVSGTSECLVQYSKGLQSGVENLVTGFDSLFKPLHFIQVKSVAGGYFVGAATASLVTDSSSSIWNF
jgi:hypothetical protein